MELFGYEITRKVSGDNKEKFVSPIPRPNDDGEYTSTSAAAGGYYGQYVDLSGTDLISDHELIIKYRETAMQPECDAAISDIVDGAIASSDIEAPANLQLSKLDQPEKVKK